MTKKNIKRSNKIDQKVKKILIFIVAYDAEKHIAKVFERIPEKYYKDSHIHILVIDDCSKDQTPEVAKNWINRKGIKNVTVLKNTINQGYGGNQKLGYLFAIQNGFDFVILLHGDGQYAPELLPLFIDTYKKLHSDVVLGSRMLNLSAAKKGGMPFYKQVGNIVLTTFQNFMTGQGISEYHTGYRGYSTNFLNRIPFQLNTNDFHFDTEILYQAFYTKAKIDEFPIPTHYGDEICHVNGLQYAWDVVMATLQFFFHRIGMFCSLKFRSLDQFHYQDKTDNLYTSHKMAIEKIRDLGQKRILDIGCGPGFVSGKIQDLGFDVTGLDKSEPLPNKIKKFIPHDLEEGTLPVNVDDFDIIMMLDVIEHLSEPEEFLLNLRNTSENSKFKLLLSTPNVAFFSIRWNLLFGRFNYSSRGILDITHKRLFTKTSLQRLFSDCGYVIESLSPIPVPFEAVIPNSLGRALGLIAKVFSHAFSGLFAFQFLIVASPKPGVLSILRKAKHYVGKKTF